MEIKQAWEIMTKNVITIRENDSLLTAIDLMLRHSISGLPVLNEKDDLVGIVSEHDVMNFVFSGSAAEANVSDAMSTKLITCSPEDDIKKIADIFLEKRIRRVPIVKGNKLIGIISRRDILREIARWYN